MQISRVNNQPNFKARAYQADRFANAAHLPKEFHPKLNDEFRKLEKIGDDSIEFTQFIDPKNHAPFSLILQRDKYETPILKSNLHLSQLAKAGEEAFKELTARDAAPHVFPEIQYDVLELNKVANNLRTTNTRTEYIRD